jgi:hypothetical protein
MNADTEIFGVLLNAELITSAIALALTFVLHRGLVFLGLHRLIWHPALFETALFVILWSSLNYLSVI